MLRCLIWFDFIFRKCWFCRKYFYKESSIKAFWKFFFCLFWLMNGRLWILLAKYLKLWKWPKPLPYMTYGLIFFLLNARGQIVFFPLVFDVFFRGGNSGILLFWSNLIFRHMIELKNVQANQCYQNKFACTFSLALLTNSLDGF